MGRTRAGRESKDGGREGKKGGKVRKGENVSGMEPHNKGFQREEGQEGREEKGRV